MIKSNMNKVKGIIGEENVCSPSFFRKFKLSSGLSRKVIEVLVFFFVLNILLTQFSTLMFHAARFFVAYEDDDPIEVKAAEVPLPPLPPPPPGIPAAFPPPGAGQVAPLPPPPPPPPEAAPALPPAGDAAPPPPPPEVAAPVVDAPAEAAPAEGVPPPADGAAPVEGAVPAADGAAPPVVDGAAPADGDPAAPPADGAAPPAAEGDAAAPPPPPPGANGPLGFPYPFDEAREAVTPWAGDAECEAFKTKFLLPDHEGPLVALASLEGSGNTWARYLLEGITGTYTATASPEAPAITDAFPGSKENFTSKTCFLVKSQGIETQMFQQAILIIRNPVELALTDFHRHMLVHKQIRRVTRDHIASPTFGDFFEISLKKLEVLIHMWIVHSQVRHVMVYENLQTDLEGELNRLLTDLGWTTDPGRMACVKKHPDSPHYVPPPADKLKFPLDIPRVQLLGQFVCRANMLFADKGLPNKFDPDVMVEQFQAHYYFNIWDVKKALKEAKCTKEDDISKAIQEVGNAFIAFSKVEKHPNIPLHHAPPGGAPPAPGAAPPPAA